MVETRSGKMQDTSEERIKAEESAKPQPGATIGRDAGSDPVVLNPNIDIPKYDGTEDPRPWIESLEEIGFLYHWADYIISRYAAMNMIGSAKTWLNLHKISFTSWENFKSRLIEDFASDANKEEIKMRLNRMQQWNEPAIRFAEDILVLCNKVDPQMEEETKINGVIGGLKKEYSFALHLNPPKNTNELLEICKKLDLFEKNYQERAEKSKALYNGPRSPRPIIKSNGRMLRRSEDHIRTPPSPRPPLRGTTRTPQSPRPPLRGTTRTSLCPRVKFVRIVEEDPSVSQDKSQENLQMDERKDYTRPRLYADVCNDTQTNIPTRNRFSVKSTINGIRKLDPRYKININVDKIGLCEALIDTGADLSVVDLRTALFAGREINSLTKTCSGPDGKKLDMVGSIILDLKIDDTELFHEFVVMDAHLRTLILGRDFLKKMNAKIDCKRETIKYNLMSNHDVSNYDLKKIKSTTDTVIPKLSIKLITASIEAEDGEYIIEENNKMTQTNGLRLARSLLTVTDKKTHIWITNPYPRPLKIMKDQTLAYGSLPAEVNFIENIEKQNENDEIQFQINKNLSFKEQERLKQILAKYTDLFSSRLGRTNLAKHQIHTEDAKPIKHKPYRVSAKERTIIKDQIDEMLEEGIIRPSSSPWSFPVILVKKRDGKYRFCVDYRKLNEVTVKDVYPIPRIDDVMDSLQGSKYFSAIDLKSGYWQVEIEERDKEKTAFTTAHGLYEFNVMPFGLCNAPATFERNMENMLGNLRWQICLCYLDDVIIYSPDFPTHLKRLEAVFRCFRESNLRLNDKKCRFGFEELEILGYITSKHGIKPAEHNIKAIRNFPRPTKVKEVQSFLGMCSYYRKFIKDFSKIADPFINLIKKSVSFTWTERQEEAFQTLKTALLSPPILGHFNPNALTYIHTDASNIGIGATLVQDIGGEEKVISYLSRTLSKAEQNYSTTEKECLAVVWSMSKLRPYLYGRHFKIVSDHHALCWLKNLKDPTGRLARWALKIQEYDFDIIHKSGKKHLDADGLSRGPLPETDWDEDFERLFLNQITDEEDKFIESVGIAIKNWHGALEDRPINGRGGAAVDASTANHNPSFFLSLADSKTKKMSEDCLSRIKVFNGENFSLWKFQFRLLLEQQKLLELLEGLEIKPNVVSSDSNSESSLQNWKSKDVKARMLLSQAIELRFLQPLVNCTSASQMWQKLLAIHEQKSEFTIGLLWRQFFDARLTSETISDYIAKIENISAQISQMGGTITEDQKVAKILNTLPSSMRYFVAAWESLDPKAQTLNNLTARLLIEKTRNQQSGSSKQDEALLHRQAGTKPKDTQRSFQDAKKNTKCHYCHKIGHWSREYRKRLANEKNKSKNLHDSKGSSSDYGLILSDNQVEPNDIWYADSGASCSMTFRREWFKTYTPFTSDHPIYLGDNSTLLAEGMGDIEIQAYVDGGWYNTYIRNVLYSPQLKKNLYSLSTSTRRGFNVIIKHDKLQIFMDNDLKAVGVRHDGLYRMLFKVTSSSQGYITSENKLQLWHERLAHLPVATLREMATKGLVDGLQPQDFEGESFFCEGCQLGKAHRKSCYPSDGKNYQLGEFIYADICGPMQTQSLSKYLYFCLFKDYFSGYRHIYFIKNKSDVLDIFKEYATLIYTQTGNKIKVLRTDNALEFKSDNFADLCKRFGIIHEFTAPYVHEQIGRIERDNRTIVEAARSATKQTPGTTPYELFFGTKPNVANYKIFGCNAYMHIPKENRKKWDNKSIKLMLLGYENTSKYFRLWDWKTRKIRISKDVTFDEKATPHSDRESTKPKEIIFQINSAPDESPVATTNIPVQEILPVSDISSHPMITRSKVSNSQCNFALADEPSNYIDAITSSDSERWKLAMDELEHAFDITSGSVNFFVGLQIEQSEDRASIFIHQSSYIDKILSKFNMADCIPASVPMDPSVILTKQDCPTPEQKEKMPKFPFREAVGSLMFASCVSRLDITYAVSQVSKFLEYPGPAHCTTVKNIFRYLKGTPHMGILFTGQDQLVGYSDSDFARDVDSRKSTTGYAFMMNGGTVSWASQRQPIIALSTTESEYIAACSAAKELIWIRRLLQGIGCDITKETELFIDNQAAIKLVENPVFHKRTKHIDVRYHFIRSKHEEGELKVHHVCSSEQLADIMTKPLPRNKFHYLRGLLNILDREGVRSIAQNFKEKDGCLFKKNPNPEGRAWLLVVPENKKREIMKEYHNHMSNGHLGVARTMYRIKSKYFWPSMLKDVSEFVKTCHLCQSRKGSNQLPSGLLQPIPPANFPFERIGIDFVGPLPSTKNWKKWIIVLTDYYTRYAETRAVSEATVKEVSKFLVEDIFLRHGAPQYLISDRGSQFTSNLMKEVMKTCKIKHCFTTSYHPQTNGLTERLNRTLINMLSMYVNTDQKNWDEILPFITHAYNTTIQETTGYSPFFLMFGREPTSLLDDRNISVDIDKDDYDEYIKHHLDKINRTRKLVINNTIKTQERMKKNYDKKHMERSYEPGELVAVWTPIRKIGKCKKLLRKYFGPYRILKKLSNVNNLIEPKDNPGQDPLIVHVSRLKPYFERIDEVTHEDVTTSGEGEVMVETRSGKMQDTSEERIKAEESAKPQPVMIVVVSGVMLVVVVDAVVVVVVIPGDVVLVGVVFAGVVGLVVIVVIGVVILKFVLFVAVIVMVAIVVVVVVVVNVVLVTLVFVAGVIGLVVVAGVVVLMLAVVAGVVVLMLAVVAGVVVLMLAVVAGVVVLMLAVVA
ncbi:hypothetical protein LAZ67_13003122 [Cordylochernes scorpioides]|uniref:RNA-directed DNA polymerase n=1 Tax=Cordylochernes scorpioides TaxID=51811 RepID=A0ABY6L527_9ARAC|nr:hypothetical protein LAZ67_13003122 [Cordylochernes scorpioides]